MQPNQLVQTYKFSRMNFYCCKFRSNYTTDFSHSVLDYFCLIELTLNDFVPPTDLIGLKKLILHIFSNQVAAFLAFYPFYFCIFWENIFYIQEEGMFASSFWNIYCIIGDTVVFFYLLYV